MYYTTFDFDEAVLWMKPGRVIVQWCAVDSLLDMSCYALHELFDSLGEFSRVYRSVVARQPCACCLCASALWLTRNKFLFLPDDPEGRTEENQRNSFISRNRKSAGRKGKRRNPQERKATWLLLLLIKYYYWWLLALPYSKCGCGKQQQSQKMGGSMK